MGDCAVLLILLLMFNFYLFGTISLTIIWIKLFLWFTVAFQVWSLVTQVKLNGEPLCRYQRTSISPCVNHQIIGGFSSEIVAHQKLYCLVTLLVNLPNHDDRGNEKIKKAKCLISKAKTRTLSTLFSRFLCHHRTTTERCQTLLEWHCDSRFNL